MGSLSGFLQRPLVAAAATVAIASYSAEIPDKLPSHGSVDACSTSDLSNSSLNESNSLWVSHISVSKLANFSFVTQIQAPVPNVNNYFHVPILKRNFLSNCYYYSFASSPALCNLYQSAALPKVPKPASHMPSISTPPSDVMYQWHLPEPTAVGVLGDFNSSSVKLKTVVVLLGWLGAKQRHLKKYAEWYTSRGYHAITFTFPMAEILSYQPGGKAEQNILLLVNHLADWLEGEPKKNLVFHTFSNTGWLIYGVILEQIQTQDPSIMGRIRGCIVDSAPAAHPDPQVWASGFSAAFLKKNSMATKGNVCSDDTCIKVSIGRDGTLGFKPAATETALLLILKKFFGVVLNLPTVNRRLSEVLTLLQSRQPSCPQLYIYSSADRVIPAHFVESFVDDQRRVGRDVRACNFVTSPHVDHFRNDPRLYTSQLSQFLEDCLLNFCKSAH